MDVPRIHSTRRWSPRIVAVAGAVVGVALLFTLGMATLEPGVPAVSVQSLFIDTVSKGPMLREVRGAGVLVPERVRFISAVTAGRVDRVHLQPGSVLEPGTVILELANPDVQIEVLEADRRLADARAALITLRVDLRDRVLEQAGRVEELRVQAADAMRRAEVIGSLREEGLSSPHEAQEVEQRAHALSSRLQLEEERLTSLREHVDARVESQAAQAERLRAIAEFHHSRERSMVVRAGTAGVLSEVPLEVGQYAQAGTILARIIPTPTRLKAVLRIAETQAAQIVPGQVARIDTRNGIVSGKVTRMDPSASGGTVSVDVSLTDALPPGARPDLQVEGAVEIERLGEVVQMARPAAAQPHRDMALFRLSGDGNHAERTPVRIGRMSVGAVEITEGLDPGDRVILSDMSRWNDVDRVRLR